MTRSGSAREMGPGQWDMPPLRALLSLVEAMNVLGRYWLEIVELPPVPA